MCHRGGSRCLELVCDGSYRFFAGIHGGHIKEVVQEAKETEIDKEGHKTLCGGFFYKGNQENYTRDPEDGRDYGRKRRSFPNMAATSGTR